MAWAGRWFGCCGMGAVVRALAWNGRRHACGLCVRDSCHMRTGDWLGITSFVWRSNGTPRGRRWAGIVTWQRAVGGLVTTGIGLCPVCSRR